MGPFLNVVLSVRFARYDALWLWLHASDSVGGCQLRDADSWFRAALPKNGHSSGMLRPIDVSPLLRLANTMIDVEERVRISYFGIR
jgi:hypothetical protein